MPESIHSPVLIGRTRELEILTRALAAAQKGAGRCILLAGEAGIGKSRLAAGVRERAIAGPFVVLQGHCSEQDRSYPYAPWIDALRAFLAPLTGKEVGERLGVFAPELVKLLPELSLLLPSIQPTPSLDPTAEKHRLFESLTRFAASLAAAHPLLVVLEDLHWSDEPSVELMHFLLRRSTTLPILVLGTYRGEDASPRLANQLLDLYRAHLAEEVQISPLTRPEVSQMAQAILRTEGAVHPGWLDRLVLFSEGNPFFVEEMIKSLRDPNQAPGEGDPLPIPRGIAQTVERRIEGLSDDTRRVLSLASVIGERFDFILLQELAAEDEPTLLRQLKELIAVQVIVEQGEDQFAFVHALTREAVYATLMLHERKAMHRTIGETLERQAGGRVDAPAAPLAYHFYHAGVWQKAMGYALRAGENAQALYAPREALTHFSHALDAAGELGIPAPFSGLRGRAHAREVLGDLDGARADHEAVLDLAGHGLDRVHEWQALIDLGFLWQSRDLERAGQYYHRALELARSIGDSAILAQSLNRVGYWRWNRGQFREGLSCHQQALALFQELNDQRGIAHTLELMGFASYGVGEVVQGAGYCERAVPILRGLDDRQGLVNALGSLSLRSRFDTEVLGDVDLRQLASLSEAAAEVARSCGYRKGEADALARTAICLCRAGDYGQGLECLRQALDIAEEIQHRELLTTVHLAWGTELHLGLLAPAQARAHLETALASARELRSANLTLLLSAHLVCACVLQNDLVRAQQLLEAVLPDDLPDATEATMPQRACWAARAELELALGHPARSLNIVDGLLAGTANLREYGQYAVPRLTRLRGNALTALGRIEEAVAELEGALTVASAQGQRPLLWRIRADLGKTYRSMGRRDHAHEQFSLARTMIQEVSDTLPSGMLHDHFLKQALAGLPAAPVLTPRRVAMKALGGLTERERQVAALIASGRSNREIAHALVIAERTVEAHITSILTKLDLRSRTEIAAWAIAKGLNHPPA